MIKFAKKTVDNQTKMWYTYKVVSRELVFLEKSRSLAERARLEIV